MKTAFNAASSAAQSTSLMAQLAHDLADIEPVPVDPKSDKQPDDAIALQEKSNDQLQAAIAYGSEDASKLGVITKQVAAGAEHKTVEQKKKEERERLFHLLESRNQQMAELLEQRTKLYNEWAEKLRGKSEALLNNSEEKFHLAEELDDLHTECKQALKDGAFTENHRERAKEKLKETQNKLGLDTIIVASMNDTDVLEALEQGALNLRISSNTDIQQAHQCVKVAKCLNERATEITQEVNVIDGLELSERAELQRKRALLENTKDNDLLKKVGQHLADDEQVQREINKHQDTQLKVITSLQEEQLDVSEQTISVANAFNF